jgi:long-chain acyl-CoA synthetase
MGVPTMYSAINGRKGLGALDLSSLVYCVSGGAPLLAEVRERFERLTGCTLVEGYGLSEAGPVCTINPIGGDNAANNGVCGSIGLPVPGTIVDILALSGPARTLPFGEPGEICVSGPQVMAGYWNADEESRAALRDGRLHTGDVGYMDSHGYVYLIDRIKDLIITGGFNVYPRVVEEAIHYHPAIEEAAVCGIPSRHRGETVMAFVKLRDGMSLKAPELRAFLGDKLAPFEIPRMIAFRDEIPKTLVGKPLRRQLVAEELRRRDGDDAPSDSAEDGGAA